MKVNIYEFDNVFNVYEVSGELVRGNFKTQDEAVYWCKQNNLHLVDVFFEVVV